MANDIKIQLSDIYEPITEKQISDAKRYVLRREQAAIAVSSLIDSLLEDAAENITKIAFRYGIDPKRFQIADSYNKDMFREISDVLDELEEEILDLTLSYSTKCTEDKGNKKLLLLWLASLGKRNRNLRQTLEDRLWIFSRDLEAMIVACKVAGRKASESATRIRQYLHAVYTMPEVKALFKKANEYKPMYIRSRGVKYGNVGSSNSEANNILRFSKTTVQMGWMKELQEEYMQDDAAGYYTLRGSDYLCSLCDSHVGWHPIDDKEDFPPFHPSCACYAVPVYEKDIKSLMQ